jgi:catechol 2,3-dioxygenase-like lactoylglutathione lyase family enzyme
MKKFLLPIVGLSIAFCLGLITMSFVQKAAPKKEKEEHPLRLGAFSVSMNVKDVKASIAFYQKLGFKQTGGDVSQNYVIMRNENTLIGLFQGFFEGHMLTFNPGWDINKKELKKFDDVREIQKRLKTQQVNILIEADEKTTGPAFIMFEDPDKNVILLDQHR